MKFIVQIIIFIIIGACVLIYLPFILLFALGSILIKWGKEDDPFMKVAREEFGSVFECFNPIRIVFKKN